MQPGGHLRRAGCILGSRRRFRSAGAQIGAEERGLIRDLLTCRERGFIENVYYVSALSGVRVRRESSIRRTTSDCVQPAANAVDVTFPALTARSLLYYIIYVARGEKRLEARRQAPCVCT